MTQAVPWVCGVCRAINQPRWTRCYSCRAPRGLEIDPDSASTSTPRTKPTRPAELAAIARRSGATYRSTTLLALAAVLAVVVVTGLRVARLGFEVQLYALAERWDAGDFARADIQALNLIGSNESAMVVAELAAWLIGFVLWGAWLSRVVANVPALGGGFTRSSPREVFLSSLVPIYNLFWMPAAVRDAVDRLSPSKSARQGLVSAWWIALVAAALPAIKLIPGPYWRFRRRLQYAEAALIAVFVLFTTMPFRLTIGYLTLVYTLLLVPAALLAYAVVRHIEQLQAARVRELGIGGAVGRSTAFATAPRGSETAGVGTAATAPSAAPPDGHKAELDGFVASIGQMNAEEVERVHQQAVVSGARGGPRWKALTEGIAEAIDAADAGSAPMVARWTAQQAAARSPGRRDNQYVLTDFSAGVWAEVILVHDHMPKELVAMAFEPWHGVLVEPAWL